MHLLLMSVSSATAPSGVCRHAANVARGMLACPSVRRVTLLTGEWQASYFRDAFGLNNERLELRPVRIPNRSYERNRWYLRLLPAIAHECGVDVVHLAFPVPVLRSRYAAPVVVSLHDLYPFDIPRNFGWRRAWLNRAALRMCMSNVDAVACVSETTRTRLHQIFPRLNCSRTVVVPNSTYVAADLPGALLPEALRDSHFLLCVAQHRANKNLPALLRSFAHLLAQKDLPATAKLVIVGSEGPETRRLHHIVSECGLKQQVLFLRDISDALLSKLYARCMAVVAPSLLEGFGLPVAEALSAGCRVVCSDIPAFRAMDSPNCTFFDLHDDSGGSLLAALRFALEAGSASAAAVSLTPREAAAMYLALYSKLLQRDPLELPHTSSTDLFQCQVNHE